MGKINKVDFYCGAFLSYLINNGVKEPTLFNAEDENAKIVSFILRDKEYKTYIKYSSKKTLTTIARKEYFSWNFCFSKSEKDFLKNDFSEENKENIVVLVCTDDKLKNTHFTILDVSQACICLGNDNVNNQPFIRVTRQKGSKFVFCHGTGICDQDAIKTEYNFDKYFDFSV